MRFPIVCVFPVPGGALNQNATVFLKLLGNANLFGVRGFAEKNSRIGFAVTIGRRICFSSVRRRRFLSNDIQERPGQIFARSKVRQDAFDGGSKTQGAGAQEQKRVTPDLWIIRFTGRCAVLEQLAARGELNNEALEKTGGRTIDERMEAFLLQLFATAADGASVHVGHGLEERGIKFDRVVGFRESEFGYGGIELELQALEDKGMVNAAFVAAPTEDAISENQLDAFGFAVDAAIE